MARPGAAVRAALIGRASRELYAPDRLTRATAEFRSLIHGRTRWSCGAPVLVWPARRRGADLGRHSRRERRLYRKPSVYLYRLLGVGAGDKVIGYVRVSTDEQGNSGV